MKTKEQFAEEIANLKHDNERLLLQDQLIRKEFAKAFNWNKPRNAYSYDSSLEPLLPSWEEIFIQLGKLLANKDFYDLEGNVSELECKLQDLETKIKKEIHPNL